MPELTTSGHAGAGEDDDDGEDEPQAEGDGKQRAPLWPRPPHATLRHTHRWDRFSPPRRARFWTPNTDVGIAIGAGTDVARASAGIVLVRNDPRDVPAIIKLSRASYAKMVQNLAWAVGYNAIALPLAAGVLAPFGIVLPVAVGAALMSLSTIIVAVNAQTLRGLKLRPENEEHVNVQPQLA